MWITRRLGLPSDIPKPLQFAALFYLAHLLCQGWIASSESFLALAVLSAGFGVWRGELKIPYHPLYLPLALFLVGSFLSAWTAPHPLRETFRVGEWFTFLTFPLALSLYVAIPQFRRVVFRTFFVLTLFLSLYGELQYFVLGYHGLEKRITGPTAHVMTFSGILLPLTLLLLVHFIYRRRPWSAAAAAIGGLALVLTFTRGAWLGWAAGFGILLILRWRKWLFYLAPVVIVAVTFSPLPFFGRLISVFDTRQYSNLDRIRMAQAGIEMIRDHPLFGVGPSNVKEVYPLYRKPDAPRFRVPHLHDNVIQIWAERGIVALAGYLALVAMFLSICWKGRTGPPSSQWVADAGLAFAIALFVAGFFEFNFGDTEVMLNMLDLFAFAIVGMGFQGSEILLRRDGPEEARIESANPLFSVL
ncbi:MAG: O-antigen ligase family protein [Thermoanaerobaculia bacterium]